jgi:hypothetical protein
LIVGSYTQGIMNVPECWEPSVNATPTSVCRAMQTALAYGAYLPWIRSNIIQAQYFKVGMFGLGICLQPCCTTLPSSHSFVGKPVRIRLASHPNEIAGIEPQFQVPRPRSSHIFHSLLLVREGVAKATQVVSDAKKYGHFTYWGSDGAAFFCRIPTT